MAMDNDAVKTIEWDAAQKLIQKKDKLMGDCFKLAKKLTTKAYTHPANQLKDMIRIGDMARKAEGMWEAAELIQSLHRTANCQETCYRCEKEDCPHRTEDND